MGGGRRKASKSNRERPNYHRTQHASRARSIPSSSDEQIELDDEAFAQMLRARGLYIRDVESDGSCLFRAISDQLYGTEDHHENLRVKCVRYMCDHEQAFAPFIEDDRSFTSYTAEMSRASVWGGNLELQALSMALKLDVRIHQLAGPVYDICNSFASGVNTTPIHLSYHQGQHYASVRRRESQSQEGPALHATLHSRQNSSDSDSLEPAPIVIDAETRAKQTESVVSRTLKLLRAVGRGRVLEATSTPEADAASCANDQLSGAMPEMPAVTTKTIRTLEMEAADIRDLVQDAVNRAQVVGRREQDPDIPSSGEYDKKLQRSRRRVYQMLDTSLSLANDLESKANDLESKATTLGVLSTQSPPEQNDKRPARSKKKQQAAKRAERKARRLREQERAATPSSSSKEPHGIKSPSSEIAI